MQERLQRRVLEIRSQGHGGIAKRHRDVPGIRLEESQNSLYLPLDVPREFVSQRAELGVWDDGNDIAGFSPLQIEQAQKYGCTNDPWLAETTRYVTGRLKPRGFEASVGLAAVVDFGHHHGTGLIQAKKDAPLADAQANTGLSAHPSVP